MAEEKIEKMSDQEKQEWFDKTREQKILNREQGRGLQKDFEVK